MEQLTDERLNEIEARANAATPGPWTTSEYRHYGKLEGFVVDAEHGSISWACDRNDDYCGMMQEKDAAFVAHARTDVPALVAEVERLRNRLETALNEIVKLEVTLEIVRADRTRYVEVAAKLNAELEQMRNERDEAREWARAPNWMEPKPDWMKRGD